MSQAELQESDTATRVRRAADQMLKEGRAREITARSIYQVIGYGSLTTINQALAEWWEALGARMSDYEQLPGIPVELQEQVVTLLTTIRKEAQASARQAFQEHEREANLRVEEAIALRDAAEQERQRQAAEIETLRVRLEAQTERARTLESNLGAERARLQAAEQHVQEARAECERVRLDATTRVSQLEQLQTLERDRFRDLETRLIAQLDEHKTARAKLEQQHRDATHSWHAKESGLTLRIHDLEQKRVKLEQQVALEQHKSETSTAESVRRNEQINTLTQELTQDRESKVSLQTELARAQSALEAEMRRATMA